MCLIAYAKSDRSQIPADNLKRAHTRNKDAWGLMYPNRETGGIHLVRDTTNHDDFRKHWLDAPTGVPIAAHFRYSTSGSDTPAMAHPFPVLVDGEDENKIVLAVMHNGVMSDWVDHKVRNQSDTYNFIQQVLTPMLVDNPDLIESEGWRKAMGGIIGNPNKLLFMRADGEVFIVNDWQGAWKEGGVWYSNEYSIEEPKPVTHSYHGGGGYYGGRYGSLGNYGADAFDWDDTSPIKDWKGKSANKEDTCAIAGGKTALIGYAKNSANGRGGWADRMGRDENGIWRKCLDGEYLTLVIENGDDQVFVIKKFTKPVSGEPLDTLDKEGDVTVPETQGTSQPRVIDVPDEEDEGQKQTLHANMQDIGVEDFIENALFWTDEQIEQWVLSNNGLDIADAISGIIADGAQYYN